MADQTPETDETAGSDEPATVRPAVPATAVSTEQSAAEPATTPAPGPADGAPPGPGSWTSRRGLLVGVGAGVVLLLLLGVGGYLLYGRYFGDPVRNAVAGNCLANLPEVSEDEEKLVRTGRIVDCSDPAAQFIVEGRLDRLSRAEAENPQVCQRFEAATFIYRGTGYVLCLSEL